MLTSGHLTCGQLRVPSSAYDNIVDDVSSYVKIPLNCCSFPLYDRPLLEFKVFFILSRVVLQFSFLRTLYGRFMPGVVLHTR